MSLLADIFPDRHAQRNAAKRTFFEAQKKERERAKVKATTKSPTQKKNVSARRSSSNMFVDLEAKAPLPSRRSRPTVPAYQEPDEINLHHRRPLRRALLPAEPVERKSSSSGVRERLQMIARPRQNERYNLRQPHVEDEHEHSKFLRKADFQGYIDWYLSKIGTRGHRGNMLETLKNKFSRGLYYYPKTKRWRKFST